jgi:geranylgeranyl diphosphate synthase type II
MNKINLETYLQEKKILIDKSLLKYLPKVSNTLAKAMQYSVMAGGKRIRPILVLAACDAVGGRFKKALPAACAFEYIHTFSLVHDDLPAMDNDDMRRGKPTSHKVFGDAIAILAGDALLTLAFDTIVKYSNGISSNIVAKLISEIGKAVGIQGMVGGQALDISLNKDGLQNETLLKSIHIKKTASLIIAAVRCGAILGNASDKQLLQLNNYARHLGLAFQIADDILDIIGTKEKLGKNTGGDKNKKKITYPAFFGLKKSRRLLRQEVNLGIKSLENFNGHVLPLQYIIKSIEERTNS